MQMPLERNFSLWSHFLELILIKEIGLSVFFLACWFCYLTFTCKILILVFLFLQFRRPTKFIFLHIQHRACWQIARVPRCMPSIRSFTSCSGTHNCNSRFSERSYQLENQVTIKATNCCCCSYCCVCHYFVLNSFFFFFPCWFQSCERWS